MSDVYTPGDSFGDYAADQESLEFAQYSELASRVQYVTSTAPYLADDPEVLATIAQLPMPTDRLGYLAGSVSAQMRLDGTLSDLQRMEPGSARRVFAQLTTTQQEALKQMGYQTPDAGTDGDNGLLGAIGQVGGALLGGVNTVLTETPIVSDVFDVMNKIDNGVKTLYRAIRTDDEASWATLAMIAGGVVAAPFTGGLSLGMTATAIAGAGLAAGTTVALLTNPSDYIDALDDNWDGEAVFSKEAQQKARTLLQSSGLDVLARDIGWEMDPYETVEMFASTPEATSDQAFMASITRVLDRVAEAGDPRREELAAKLVQLVQIPEFRESVELLQHSKVSFGRDIARIMGVDPGTSTYSFLSGSMDALFTIVTDPTLAAGSAFKWARARRLGVPIRAGEEAFDTINAIAKRADEVPTIGAAYDQVALAVNSDSPHLLWRRVPQAKGLYDDLWNYKELLRDQGLADDFTREHIFDWLREGNNFERMLAGHGVQQGYGRLMLPTYGWRVPVTGQVVSVGKIGEGIKAAIDFADDAGNRSHLRRVARKLEKENGGPAALGPRIEPQQKVKGALRYSASPDEEWRNIRRFIDLVDGIPLVNQVVRTTGSMLAAFTEMMPATRSISMVGPQAFEDIQRFVGLGRTIGMTSVERKGWFDTIMQQDNIEHRINASLSFLDSMLTAGGSRASERGAELTEQFLTKVRHRYSLGDADAYLMGERTVSRGIHPYQHTFDLPIPDLHELRRYAEKGMLLKYVYGAVDNDFTDVVINKIWKPAVLLRLGFITRAGGEELLAHMARSGPSALLAEFGARSVAEGRLHSKALQAARDLEKLGPEQIKAIERMRYAAHVRPLERMFANWNWTSPANDVLRRYTDFIRNSLEHGLIPNLAERIPASRQLALLGKEGGFRRSILMGVDPDLIRYAESFGRKHASSIMREVSSHNANIWSTDAQRDRSDFRLRYTDRSGELQELGFMVERGKFKVYRRGDPMFDRAAHGGVAKILNDEVTGPIYHQVTSRWAPPTVTDDQAYAALDVYREVEDWRIRAVVDELLTHNDGRTVNWESTLRNITKGDETLGDYLRAAHRSLGESPAEARKVFKTLRSWNREANGTMAKLSPYGQEIERQLVAAERLVAAMETSGTIERAWLGSFLDQWGRVDETPELIRGFDQYRGELAARLRDRHYDVEVQPLVQDLSYTNRLDDGTPVASAPRERRTRLWVPQMTAEAYGRMLSELRMGGGEQFLERIVSLWADAQPHLAGLHIGQAESALRRFIGGLALEHPNRLAQHAKDIAAGGRHGDLIPLGHMGFDDPDVAQRFSQFLNGVLSRNGTELSMAGRMRDNKGYVALLDLDDKLRHYNPTQVDGAKRPIAHPAYQDRVTFDYEKVYDPDGGVDWIPVQDTARTRKESERVLHSWALDREHISPRLVSVADRELVTLPDGTRQYGADPREAITQGVDKAVTDWLNHIGTNTAQERIVRGVIYSDPDAAHQIPIGSKLNVRDDAYDAKGNLVEYDDPVAFALLEPTSGINVHENWTMLGPLLRDAADNFHGTSRLVPDTRAIDNLPDIVRERRGDMAPLDGPNAREFRGHWSHMQDLANPPIVAVGPSMVPISSPTRWDKVLEFGFEKVISPAIDAIIRRPLAFHMYAEAMRENERALRWGLSKHLFGDESTGATGELYDRFAGVLDDPSVKVSVEEYAEHALAATRVLDPATYDELVTLTPSEIVNAYYGKYADDNILKGSIDKQTKAARRAIFRQRADLIQTRMLEAGPRTRIKKDIQTVRDFTYQDHLTDKEVLDGLHSWSVGMRPDGWDNVPERVLNTHIKTVKDLRADTDMFELFGDFTYAEWDEAIAAAEASKGMQRWTLPIRNNQRPIEGVLQAYQEHLGDHLGRSWDEVQRHLDVLPEALRAPLDANSWAVLSASHKNTERLQETVEYLAAERAIRNSMPYLDSHEIRSQAGEYVRGFFPFMYAEENFLKRWARTLKVAPDAIRKGQLLYAGLKSGGVIRTDSQGRDWFVYPGAGMVAEVINRSTQSLGFGEVMPSGVVFATETKNILPGFDVERTGMPSANPLIAVPLGGMSNMFSELRPIQEALVGQAGVSQGGIQQFIPAAARRFWDVAGDEESNKKYASAMMSAMAVLEHNGHGLPENATANQLDEYIRRVRNHTRGILLTQAFTGFIVPGAPSIQFTGESSLSFENITGIGADVPADLFRTEYLQMVQELGIEEGTAAYFELNPDHTVEDLMPFTVGQSVSKSGAPLPATAEAVAFADANEGWISQYPMAAAWLLPQPPPGEEEFDEYAYVQQSISGMRERRTPLEFMEALKYREGALDYFQAREAHERDMKAAEGDSQRRGMLNDVWATYKARHLALHPIFAEQLEGGEARARRAKVLDELRVAVEDPGTPEVGHLGGVRELVQAFDTYQVIVSQMSGSRSAADRERVENFKLVFEDRITTFLMDRPELEPLWLSVLRPEASL